MATPKNSQIGKVTDVSFRFMKKKKSKTVSSWLAVRILCNLPIQDIERQRFIEFCRAHYEQNELLDQISEFERRYRPDEAIQWYTRPSGFPSKLINKICRTQNPRLISNIRYFLKHIHEQLTRLYLESIIWIPEWITIYRGQSFTAKDFRKLVQSKGKTMFSTTLLSTTSCDDIAVMFSGSCDSSIQSRENTISVVFKISIETKTTRSKPFAYIQEYSHVKDEKEVLLSIGTIFSCVDIHKRAKNLYEISWTRGRKEEEIEKELSRKAMESFNHGAEMTVKDFLLSMNICTTPMGDFHRRPLSSLLEEIPDDIVNEISTNLPSTIEEAPPVDATHNHLIIWLDSHIGSNGVCTGLKKKLSNAINVTMDEPVDRHETDLLIQAGNIYPLISDQLIAVQTIEECLQLIDSNCHKKIFLITSGSLGRELVYHVMKDYPYVERIFVFCANIRSHMDWAWDYTENLLMFDFHNDLFSRLVYEIGMYYKQQGMIASVLDDHRLALYYYYIAKKLVMRANLIFQRYIPCSLTTIEELIINEEQQLPRHTVQQILSHLSYR